MRPLAKLYLLLIVHGQPWRSRFIARGGWWQLTPWCVLLLLALPAAAAPTTRPALLAVVEGRLVATCRGVDENYTPAGYWSGSVTVSSSDGAVRIDARRQEISDWTIIDLAVTQGPRETSAAWTVRTPINMPDFSFRESESSLALLLIRHHELLPPLNEVLAACGAGRYAFDAVTLAQADPNAYRVPAGISEKVAALLPGLDGGWRERDKAICGLTDLGSSGAAYMILRLDRSALTVNQRLGVETALAGRTVLSEADRSALKRIIQ